MFLFFVNLSFLPFFRNVAYVNWDKSSLSCDILSLKCSHLNEIHSRTSTFFSFALFFMLRRYGRKNIHGAVFHRIATTILRNHFLYRWSVIFFLLPLRLGGIEGGKGVGKREISRADKRIRFIASLILFIDTRIALRLRRSDYVGEIQLQN